MKARQLRDGIHWVGAVDWDRRLFDSLIPIPDGTSYNAYVVRGRDRTALIDTVEPGFADTLFARLADLGVDKIDYVVSNHAEQDHSGSLPMVLARYPGAQILTSPKGKGMLTDLLPLSSDAIRTVDDGETVDLGGKTLRFLHFPWVHWPETMLTYVPEDKVLFPCDLFGSHLASNELISSDPAGAHMAAKLYFAQIMMPFRKLIAKNLGKVEGLPLELIAPSHGPVHARPETIVSAYKHWVGDTPRNLVALPYISMHESTRIMVDHLIDALTDRDVRVERFNLEAPDLGKLATALVDAATIVLGTPTVLGGAHPNALYAAHLAAILRPKARHATVIGSYGWGGKVVDQVAGVLGPLKLELLDPVLSKGYPSSEVLGELDRLAEEIATRHRELGCAG